MRRAINITGLALAAMLVTACASTAKGRELQAAEAIIAANNSAKTALQFEIISPDDAQIIRFTTKAAETTLIRAVESRRAGQDKAADALLDAVFEALVKVSAMLEERQK